MIFLGRYAADCIKLLVEKILRSRSRVLLISSLCRPNIRTGLTFRNHPSSYQSLSADIYSPANLGLLHSVHIILFSNREIQNFVVFIR